MAEAGLSPFTAIARGLRCRCPNCGGGRLLSGYLTPALKCEQCALDFSSIDAGDGPAVFVILIAGFLVVGLALVAEIVWRPPYWVHTALWIPLMLATTLGLLRPFKGVLMALQLHNKAGESRFQKE